MDEREVMSMSISEQFTGLPMKDLIGSPLAAAADASINLANSTADFINRVGFDKDGNVRNVAFKYEKISKNEDGTLNLDAMKVDVPMLAIVPIPNLQVDEVNVLFDMEVKQSEKSESTLDLSASATAKLDLGLFSVSVSGSVSAHQNNTRSSDNSAKYHVDVRAANHGTPEGLARVLDMMAANVAPSLIGSSLKDENGQDLVGEAKTRAEKRKKLMNEKKAFDRRIKAAQNLLDMALLAMKRNMDEQMSLHRIALTKLIDDEEAEDKKNKLIAIKDELNQEWASAQNMLPQNIEALAIIDKSDESTQIADVLRLKCFSIKEVGDDPKEKTAVIEQYVEKEDNKAEYAAILHSQNNAIKRQKELNILKAEFTEKEEEYNEAFN